LITFGDKWIKEAKVVFWRPFVTYDLDGKKKVCHQLDDKTQLSVKFHESRLAVAA